MQDFHPIVARHAALILCAGLACAAASAQQFQGVPPPAPGRSAQPAKPIPVPELLSELRKGGYVIYFRHTSTDFSRDDVKSRSDDDCETSVRSPTRGARKRARSARRSGN